MWSMFSCFLGFGIGVAVCLWLIDRALRKRGRLKHLTCALHMTMII
jgi:hypothetical protein